MSSQEAENSENFVVESIFGFKFEKELLFFVKWRGYPVSKNTWEPVDGLKFNIVFQTYIKNLYASLESDIEKNNVDMMDKLRKEMNRVLREPKPLVMNRLGKYNKYEFKAHQIAFHYSQVHSNKEFIKKFKKLFINNHILQNSRRQIEESKILLVEIRRSEMITVTFENDFDFSWPQSFRYISQNILPEDLKAKKPTRDACMCIGSCCLEAKNNEKEIVECGNNCECGLSCMHRQSQQPKNSAFVIFKTEKHGWGLKPLTKIAKGKT